jgi:hypothetical protein
MLIQYLYCDGKQLLLAGVCRAARCSRLCMHAKRLTRWWKKCRWHAQDTNTLMEHQKDLLAQLRPVSWANVVYTSAKTGQRLSKVLEAVAAAGKQHRLASQPQPQFGQYSHSHQYSPRRCDVQQRCHIWGGRASERAATVFA